MNTESRTKNTVRNIFAGFLGQIINSVIGIISRVVFVRCLSEAYVGVNGLFTSILSALSLAELGIGSAIGYELYKGIAKKDEEELAAYICWYGKAYKIIACVVAMIGLMLLPVIPYLAKGSEAIKENVTIVYLLYLLNSVVSYFYKYKVTIITADQKGYKTRLVDNINTITACIVKSLILILSRNYILYTVCQIGFTLIGNIVTARIAEKEYPFIKNKASQKLSKEKTKRLLVNTKALFITKIGSYLVNGTDSIIISALNGLNINGIISNITLLTSTLNLIIMQFVSGVTASVGNLNATESKEKVVSVFWQMNLFCFWIYGWATAAFIVLGNDIVRLAFGENYIVSIPVLLIIAFNFYSAGIMNSSWTFKNAMGLFRYGQSINFIMGIINIVCSFIFGRVFGVFGVLLATAFSRMSTDYWYCPYALFKYGFMAPYVQYIRKWMYQFLTLIITVITLMLLSSQLCFSYSVNFGIKLLACIVVPHILFLLFWFKSEEFCLLRGRAILIYQAVAARRASK